MRLDLKVQINSRSHIRFCCLLFEKSTLKDEKSDCILIIDDLLSEKHSSNCSKYRHAYLNTPGSESSIPGVRFKFRQFELSILVSFLPNCVSYL